MIIALEYRELAVFTKLPGNYIIYVVHYMFKAVNFTFTAVNIMFYVVNLISDAANFKSFT